MTNMPLEEFEQITTPLPDTCPICNLGEVIAEECGDPCPFVECDNLECRVSSEGETLEDAVDNFIHDHCEEGA